MTKQQFEDVVSHPVHYNRGKIEVWDFIADHRLDYLRGNAVKYISRAGFKDDRVQDLLKAKEYLKKALTNSTYPREVAWGQYTPKIDPVEFARDQQLEPPLAASMVLITQWDIEGALHYLNQVLAELESTAEPAKTEKHNAPVVYGRDEERFGDNRKDTRIVEFGKRMGEGR